MASDHEGYPIGGRDRSLDEPMRRPTQEEADQALGKGDQSGKTGK